MFQKWDKWALVVWGANNKVRRIFIKSKIVNVNTRQVLKTYRILAKRQVSKPVGLG